MVADEPRGPPCIDPASWIIAGAPGAELSTDLNPPPAAPGPLPYSKMVVIVFDLELDSIQIIFLAHVVAMKYLLPVLILLPERPFPILFPDRHDSWSDVSLQTLSLI